MTATITISGCRQSGKTEAVIDHMVRHARAGMKVMYVGEGLSAIECQRRIDHRGESDVWRSSYTNGRERILFETGGEIRFLRADRLRGYRGLVFDVLAWDVATEPIDQFALYPLATSANPRIYRTVLE